MIAAALLLQLVSTDAKVAVGPFLIEAQTSRLEEVSYPFPPGYESKSTTIRWKSSSGLANFDIVDTGIAVTGTLRLGVERGACIVVSNNMRLAENPGMALGASCKFLPSEIASQVKRELEDARPFYAAAYAQFRIMTLRQHGTSLTRCRRDKFGYHGPICVAFWDLGRSADRQYKNERTH